jgi:rhodanese-related sulfurtransferase
VPGVAAAPRVVVRDAVVVVAACALVGSIWNLVRPHGIPFIQKEDYQILVPCPEGGGEAPGMAAEDPVIWESRTLLVDARPAADYARWHPPNARHLAFDYLEPAPKDEVGKIASSGAARVVVFGDGGDPDSGEQLARELAGSGIRNIFFVQGGAQSLEAAAAKAHGKRGGP